MAELADVTVREAVEADQLAVRRLVDAAMLLVEDLEAQLSAGNVLVACDQRDRIVGTLVLDGDFVVAIAVTRSLRNQGIGTRLIEQAAERTDRLVAEFDRPLRPFYDTLGFEIEPVSASDRLRGVYTRSSTADRR